MNEIKYDENLTEKINDGKDKVHWTPDMTPKRRAAELWRYITDGGFPKYDFIAKQLNEFGYTSERGKRWTSNMVSKLLFDNGFSRKEKLKIRQSDGQVYMNIKLQTESNDWETWVRATLDSKMTTGAKKNWIREYINGQIDEHGNKRLRMNNFGDLNANHRDHSI